MSKFNERRGAFKFLLPFGLALFFLILSFPTTRRASWYEQIWWTIITPPQKFFTAIGNGTSGIWRRYISVVNAESENIRLKARIAQLEEQLIELNEIRKQNERLSQLLSFKYERASPVLIAKVIANDPRSEFQEVVVSAGFDDGVRVYMPVVGPGGLVGRVGMVGKNESRVLLITDPNSSVDAIVQRSGQRVLVVGSVMKSEVRPHFYMSRLEFLTGRSDIEDGDVIVSSGLDGIFPPGIPIGTVAHLKRDSGGVFIQGDLIPFQNMAELREIMIMQKVEQ